MTASSGTSTPKASRRTQNVSGHIMLRAPYHWTGDMKDIPTLMDNVFSGRMEGGETTRSQKMSLGPFLDRVSAPLAPPATDAAAVARGQALFESTDTACTGCHNGQLLTNLQKFDVGTGGVFKVPSLIGVGGRALPARRQRADPHRPLRCPGWRRQARPHVAADGRADQRPRRLSRFALRRA